MKLRILQLPKVKLSRKQRLIMVSGAFMFAFFGGLLTFIYFNIGKPEKAEAALNGDFRSVATGNWGTNSTWQKFNGTSWVAATSTPVTGSGTITLQSPYVVTVAASVTADQIVVNSGATLKIADAKVLTLNNGTGTDLDVFGIVQEIGTGATGASIANTSGTIVFENGGRYQHNFSNTTTQGAIPLATWSIGSTCEYIGFVSGTAIHATNLDQSFYNFTWNCPNQTSTYDLAGLLTNINGDFTITSSGSTPKTVYGISSGSSGLTMNIDGNLIISGGIFDFAHSSVNGNTRLYLGGNYNQTGGTFQTSSTDEGGMDFHFTGAGKIYTKTSGTLTTTNINFFVDNGADLTLNNNFTNSNSFKVSNGGTLICGTTLMSGGGSFNLASGGSINIGSTGGIATSGATGNIQTTSRTFNIAANYTYDGTANQITGSALTTANNLTINNSTGVSLSGTVNVNGILSLSNGKLTTGSYEVWHKNSSASSITGQGSTNYIIGNLRRTISSTGSYDFPLGTAAYYELINLNLTSIAGFTNVLGSFTNSNPVASIPLSGIYVTGTQVSNMLNYGFWTLTPNSSMTSGSYSVTLKEQGQSSLAASAGCYCVLKRANVSSAWQSLGSHTNSTQSVVSGVVTAVRSGLSSFSDFGIGYNSGTTLPITLSSFTVKLNDNLSASIEWITSAELNNEYFEVQRSSDGKTFETIGKVDGMGTSLVRHDYNLYDPAPLDGISYYRLKQVDFDGKFTLSSIQSLNNVKDAVVVDAINVFPNPATSEINVSVQMNKQENQNVQIVDLAGKIVFSRNAYFNEGQNQLKLPIDNLPSGYYFIKISSEKSKPVLKKFLKS